MLVSDDDEKKPRRHAKRATVRRDNDKLAYQRIVYLPYDLATFYAAMQNFRIDLAKGIHPNMKVWPELELSYVYEADSALKNDGANFFPGDNGECWIHSKNMHLSTPNQPPSVRVIHLREIADLIFSNDDESLLDRPDLLPPPDATGDTEIMLALLNCRRLLKVMH